MYRIIDLHSDSLMYLVERKENLSTIEGTHINLEKLKQGGSLAQCFAIYIVRDGEISMMDYLDVAYEKYSEEMEKNKDVIRPVYHASDILQNEQKGYLSSILTVEDGVNLDGHLETLAEMYDKGVRMITLTHNYENSLGYPNSPDPTLHALGLKAFGLEAVERMNELGIAVDVSHLSEGGFWDCIRVSKKPIIASHSCARSLCSHQRNLTDDQIKAIAEKGGVIGINFYHKFLRDDTEDNLSRIDDVVRHLAHFASVGGVECMALGSDYDGIDSTLEWKDFSGFPMLMDRIEREFGSANVEKIAWRNAYRALQECIG